MRTIWPDKTKEQVWKGTKVRVAKKKAWKLSTHVGICELTSQTKLRSKVGKIINWGTKVKGENVQAAYIVRE